MPLRPSRSESLSNRTPPGRTLRILVIGGGPSQVDASLAAAGHGVTLGRPDQLVTLAALHDLVVVNAWPGGRELAALTRARSAGVRTPAIVLLDGEVEERVRGLDAGADDCLSRPVAPAELRARIRAVERRCPLSTPPGARAG